MLPDFPYPAALDIATTVWKEVVKSTNPENIAIFGTSTGGGMMLAMVLRAGKEGLPLPAATAPGTPWSDMTKTGDTYFTNEMLDNFLVSNDGARVLIGVLMLGIPERKLRVVAPDVGGGFGSKQVVYAEEALVTWAARKLERPRRRASRAEAPVTLFRRGLERTRPSGRGDRSARLPSLRRPRRARTAGRHPGQGAGALGRSRFWLSKVGKAVEVAGDRV
jgi:acetyl esterase/lipase